MAALIEEEGLDKMASQSNAAVLPIASLSGKSNHARPQILIVARAMMMTMMMKTTQALIQTMGQVHH